MKARVTFFSGTYQGRPYAGFVVAEPIHGFATLRFLSRVLAGMAGYWRRR